MSFLAHRMKKFILSPLRSRRDSYLKGIVLEAFAECNDRTRQAERLRRWTHGGHAS
jgi:hypothetical protein